MKKIATGLLAWSTLLAATSATAQVPSDDKALETKLVEVVPSERQYDFERKHEVYAFVHFGPNTFTGREWGTGSEKPSVFNPTALDAKQWAKALKSAGMTMAVLTCKHHDGFCLWPSRYTDQSVKSSPWKDGKGDIFREFADAVRAEGMEVGVYLSPADLFQMNDGNYYGNGSQAVDSVIPTDPTSLKSAPTKLREIPAGQPGAGISLKCKVDDYNRYYLNQLFELFTEYGPISYINLDGALPRSKGGQKYAYQTWYELIRKLAPNACISVKGPDLRWVGNENGIARETEWSVIGIGKPEDQWDWPDLSGKMLGDRATLAKAAELHWYPAECNTSILPGWFFHDNQKPKSPDRLMEIYEQSVGRNGSLILNVPPDKRGLFSDEEVANLKAFGENRSALYGTNQAVNATVSASSSLPDHQPADALDGKYETWWEAAPRGDTMAPVTLDIKLPRFVTFKRIQLQEQIKRSQRVESFIIETQNDKGDWIKLVGATTIGYKRILAVPETTTDHLRVRFDSYRVAPTLAEFALFY